MPVNLYQLDCIKDYKHAISVLDGFIAELTAEFVVSIEGNNYLQVYPSVAEDIGIWIDRLLRFGYIYESVTLPYMTLEDIDTIVTQIFPDQISSFDLETVDIAIFELMAFWQFLKREYQLSHASKIVKFLQQIEPKFSLMMHDPNDFGGTKPSRSNASIFDLAKTEEINNFQQLGNFASESHSDRKLIKADRSNTLENTNNLNDLVGDLGIKGSKILSHGERISLEKALRELATELLTAFPEEVPTAKEFWQQLEKTSIPMLPPIKANLSPPEIAVLKQQRFTKKDPGTILQDFQTLLNFIGEVGIPVGTKRHFISMKSLAQLNQKLTEPIAIDLQRPQQKSYPTINGLYLLLRATGIGKVLHQGKKARLMLDRAMLANWQQMNLTERYFNLLDAWLIIADEEILGERGCMTEGARCLQYWTNILAEGQKFQDYKQQQELVYYPGFHNLALMKLFGLIEATYGKPDKGKGWRVKSVKPTAWGKATIEAAFPGWTNPVMLWDKESTEVKFGELQSVLKPYFPQWQKKIELPQVKSIAGVYVFKVSWHQIWRRIAISSDMTFWDLSQLILQSVDFDSDHLDLFIYKNRLGKTSRIVHPYMEESPATDETKIADLPLEVGSTLEYLFDFGDNWEFQLEIESIDPKIRPNYGEIIASEGKAPQQYPDWEEY